MDGDSKELTWKRTDTTPWGDAPTRAQQDAILHEADVAEYRAMYGHIERRHREVAILHACLQVATAIISGLIMALGFHPLAVFVIGILVWRCLEDVVDRHNDADERRRAAHGVD